MCRGESLMLSKIICEYLGSHPEGALTDELRSFCLNQDIPFTLAETSEQKKLISRELSKMKSMRKVTSIREGRVYRWKLNEKTPISNRVNKTAKMNISFWQSADGIHIRFNPDQQNGVAGITTINNSESSKRCHKHLYSQLKSILMSQGRWNEEIS
jgi:hypothetical protein